MQGKMIEWQTKLVELSDAADKVPIDQRGGVREGMLVRTPPL